MASLSRTIERKMFFAGMNKKQRKTMKGNKKWSEIREVKQWLQFMI